MRTDGDIPTIAAGPAGSAAAAWLRREVFELLALERRAFTRFGLVGKVMETRDPRLAGGLTRQRRSVLVDCMRAVSSPNGRAPGMLSPAFRQNRLAQ